MSNIPWYISDGAIKNPVLRNGILVTIIRNIIADIHMKHYPKVRMTVDGEELKITDIETPEGDIWPLNTPITIYAKYDKKPKGVREIVIYFDDLYIDVKRTIKVL